MASGNKVNIKTKLLVVNSTLYLIQNLDFIREI